MDQSFYQRRQTRDNLHELSKQNSGSIYVRGGTSNIGVFPPRASGYIRRDSVSSRYSNTFNNHRDSSFMQRRGTTNSRMSNTYYGDGGHTDTIMERRDSVSSRDSMFSKILGRNSLYQKISMMDKGGQQRRDTVNSRISNVEKRDTIVHRRRSTAVRHIDDSASESY